MSAIPSKRPRFSAPYSVDRRRSVPEDGGSSVKGRLTMPIFSNRNIPVESKKYLCIGGFVYGAKDGDKHFVSCSRLPALYGVSPDLCVFVPDGDVPKIEINADGRLTGSAKLLGIDSRRYVLLRPDSTGAYRVPSPAPSEIG